MLHPHRRSVVYCLSAFLVLLAMACSDRNQISGPPRGSAPGASRTISDGAHNGNSNVFFLPPMVANPTKAPGYGDPFQSGLSVSINVRDEFTNTYVATFGPSAVGVNTTDGYYFVNWDTKATTLDVTHTYRVELIVGGKMPAYAEVILVNNGSGLKNVDTQDFVGLVDGRTLPIKVRIEQGLTFDCMSTNSGACTTTVVPPTLPPGQTAVVQTGDQQNAIEFSGAWSNASNPVVVTVEDVTNQPNPVNCQTLVNVTLAPVAQNHCLHITTDPQVTLQTPAIVVTCWARNEDHRELLLKYDVTETPQFLQDGPIPVGIQCPTQIGSARPSSNPFVRFASAVLSGIGRVFSVTPAYAFDSGVGSIVDAGSGFSYFSPAVPQQLSIVSGDLQTGGAGFNLAKPLIVRDAFVHDVGGANALPSAVTNAQIVCQTGTGSATATNNGDGTYTCPPATLVLGQNSFKVSILGQPDQVLMDTGDGALPLAEAVTFHATGVDPQLFNDGFETALGWADASLAGANWNRSLLLPIRNSAYSTDAASTYVALAPGDLSNGALPSPAAGSYAAWYGNAQNGNYLGAHYSADYPNSGGLSAAPNNGTYTSPAITIPAGVPGVTLGFDTWWEIESVNPSHYDLMQVYVNDVATNTTTGLGQLNPTGDPTPDPNDPAPQARPYSSGYSDVGLAGYNKPPLWTHVSLDLSAYAGRTIRLEFVFNTVDANYNGFRGWIVDNVNVAVNGSVTIQAAGSLIPRKTVTAALNPITAPGAPRNPR